MHVNSFGGDRRMGMTWNACLLGATLCGHGVMANWQVSVLLHACLEGSTYHTVQSDEEEWVLLVPRYDRSHFKIGLGQLRCPVKSFDAA